MDYYEEKDNRALRMFSVIPLMLVLAGIAYYLLFTFTDLIFLDMEEQNRTPEQKNELQEIRGAANQVAATKINLDNQVKADLTNADDVLQAMQDAEAAPLNMSGDVWNPTLMNESRRLMFMGHDFCTFESKYGNKDVLTLPYVQFAEAYVDSTQKTQIRIVSTARASIVNFFLQYNKKANTITGYRQPQKSAWLVTYQGVIVKGDKNIHNYSINPLVIK
ncbi:hypothetical protein V6R21_20400 [Limibacter armeniacum]|uniref:hypothetical protein n=1 Tax=Limibacter armeniacum TaxID=466084 RepID=UPI002FE5F74E